MNFWRDAGSIPAASTILRFEILVEAKSEAKSLARRSPVSVGGCRAAAIKRMRMKFYYVYVLQSEIDQERFYTGFTEDLNARLKSHNSGGCDHNSKYRPWSIKTAIAFNDWPRSC